MIGRERLQVVEEAKKEAAAERETLDRDASRLKEEKAKLDAFTRGVKENSDKVPTPPLEGCLH